MTPSPMRRVIPPGYLVCELELTGQTPLLMSSAEADRRSDTYRAYRALSKKRAKTLEDEDRLRELEFYTRLYYDEQVGVYLPGRNVKELLRSAATKWRQGEDVKRSLIVPEYRLPLTYSGMPKTPEQLWKGGYYFVAMVSNAGAGSGRVERTRPMFEEWSLKSELAFDPEDLDLDAVQSFVERSRKYGIGDYRPDFGAFDAKLTFLRQQRTDANAEATNPRDNVVEAAVQGAKRRLMEEADARASDDNGQPDAEELEKA